ncbi:type 1 glutamine amidotransferase domain-containing protein [Lewinella sp. 4G2]|uniref:type 1 glutamine amidotransferase domain-containing protein n=1 Tax=Lewinella sp. 4G2 TaxID=1803372 RepID=UPI0007B4C7C8|nr:type 1 glutamine amidotransferase domain-containing protein [Lewinella sp. 4G2]OAV46279.1 protease [Lewinella sp. 4G2]
MQLSNLRVAALATNGFEEVELTQPRKALEEAGATVTLISPESGKIKAWAGDDWGGTYDVDVVLSEETMGSDYDALLLPGGVLSPDALRINGDALAFVDHFFREGKPVAAICHGSQTMISAGLVQGKRMTAYKAIRTDLVNAGAIVVDEPVVVDGTLVTSRNPDDIPAFNEKMVEVFSRAAVPA